MNYTNELPACKRIFESAVGIGGSRFVCTWPSATAEPPRWVRGPGGFVGVRLVSPGGEESTCCSERPVPEEASAHQSNQGVA